MKAGSMGDASAICSIAGPGEPSKLSSFLQDLQGTGVNSRAEVLALVTAALTARTRVESEGAWEQTKRRERV